MAQKTKYKLSFVLGLKDPIKLAVLDKKEFRNKNATSAAKKAACFLFRSNYVKGDTIDSFEIHNLKNGSKRRYSAKKIPTNIKRQDKKGNTITFTMKINVKSLGVSQYSVNSRIKSGHPVKKKT